MSFMFKPFPYEDRSAINKIKVSPEIENQIVEGTDAVCDFIFDLTKANLDKREGKSYVICLDGFIGAQWRETILHLVKSFDKAGIEVETYEIKNYYKDDIEIEEMLSDYLPNDREMDPVLLYGKIFPGEYEDFFDKERLQEIEKVLSDSKSTTTHKVVIVYGNGAAIKQLRDFYDVTLYYDVAPLEMTLRINKGEVTNLGRKNGYEFRRFYYVDYEVAYKLRDELLDSDFDYYIDSNKSDNLILLPKNVFDSVMSKLVKQPVRCKPIYLEGVWGGYYFMHMRNLPKTMKNCAWIFDLIPNEVSLLCQVNETIVEFPFLTYVKKEGVELMGKECVEKFEGIFPIRFNYDDTYHSSGNMSIQVHPTYEYATSVFNEQFQQDEAYYVIATGQNAKTYLGLKENTDFDEFYKKILQSEKSKNPIEHDAYVNSVPSKPGMQFLIPGGTIHSSGRNQVVLELGSCTMGSMTFKMYDYVRLDINNKPRPIHSKHGKNVLQTYRRSDWVKKNLVLEPKLIDSGEGWKEFLIGEFDSIFFSLRRLEFDKVCYQNTNDQFHVLTLVDGEHVRVRSKENPEYCYDQHFLEIVIVPANMGSYVIENLGSGPVCMHKARVK